MSSRVGKPVINTVTGFLHIYPCPRINRLTKKPENWIIFDNIVNAKKYAEKIGLKLKPCSFCALEAYYV